MLESIVLRRVLLAVAALVGATAVFLAFWVSDTDNNDVTITGNSAIDALIPPRNSEVLAQDNVGVDLASGYDARLVINGIPIPVGEIRHLPNLNRFTFRPDEGKALERLQAEQNCAQASYWKLEEGPSEANTITWCFTAS